MHEDVLTLTQARIRLLKMMLIHADPDPQLFSEVNFKTAVDFLPVHWWFKILMNSFMDLDSLNSNLSGI